MVVNETLRPWCALFIATAITAEVLFYSDCTNCT